MLNVLTPEEVYRVIENSFDVAAKEEAVALSEVCDRILTSPVTAGGDEPPFNRSTVDGYAVKASDTFGASESLPAILELAGEIRMGELSSSSLPPDSCIRIPTGGSVPEGADCVVMQEYTEDYEDGTIGVTKPAAPGENMVFKGDDVRKGDVVLPAGRLISPKDVGTLASLGVTQVLVRKPIRAGIFSTGDELVPEYETPGPGQIRDINSRMLAAVCGERGCEVTTYGIIPDDLDLLKSALQKALAECDIIIISGGSSVGEKDNSVKAISSFGEILFHGIAMKPGKPTLLGKVLGKPVFGLPGHPQAAFFTAKLYVCAAIDRLLGQTRRDVRVPAAIAHAVSANDGRALFMPVTLKQEGKSLTALPLHSKSGLVSGLARADGFISIPRNCEGIRAGETVMVTLF